VSDRQQAKFNGIIHSSHRDPPVFDCIVMVCLCDRYIITIDSKGNIVRRNLSELVGKRIRVREKVFKS